MDLYGIPQVNYANSSGVVTVENDEGNYVLFDVSEARDLGRTLIALADEAGE